MTEKIKSLRKERNKKAQTWNRSKNLDDREVYRLSRNRLKQEIRRAKRFYLSESTKNLGMKKAWGTLREWGIGKQRPKLNDDIDLEGLNQHFAQLGKGVTKDTVRGECQRIEQKEKLKIPEFKFRKASINEVSRAVIQIKSKAVGVDGIPIQFVQKFCPKFCLKLFMCLIQS